MTTYKEIFGKQIKQLSTDPTDAEAEGQIWFNTTEGVFKSVLNVGAWSAGGNMGTARYNAGGAGIQTAALGFAGSTYPSPPTVATEEYNGSSWTAGGNLSVAKLGPFGFGTQTAAVSAAGQVPGSPGFGTATTEEYDGSSWTTVNNMATAGRRNGDAVGILTAGVAFGGNLVSGYTNATEEYDGTNWTGGGNLTTARESFQAAGTLTAALASGGYSGSYTSDVEEYNGTAWSEVNNLPATRGLGSGSGIQTNALIFAGNAGGLTATALRYDGTNWSTEPSMSTARANTASAQSGTADAALGFSGYSPLSNATEEFNTSVFSPIAATWASTTSTPSPSAYSSGASGGTPNAGFMAGGFSPPNAVTNATLNFDGSSWTSSGNLGASKARMNLGVSGTQTAGLSVGGFTPGSLTSVEEYDGSNWTGGGALPTATQQSGGAGPQTSYMMLGTDSDRSEGLSYNGSAWGSEGSSSQGFAYGALTGQETAALAFYGATSPAGTSRSTGEEYNGTAWTTVVPSLPDQGSSGSAGGTSTASVFAGSNATARYWDGTTVGATASMAVSTRGNFYAIGNSANGFLAVNGSPANHSVEQYNEEQQALGYKTLTSS